MDEILVAIDAALKELNAKAIGEYVKIADVQDLLLDLRSLAVREPVPA